MRKITNRLLAGLLSIILVLSMLPISGLTAFAAEDEEDTSTHYDIWVNGEEFTSEKDTITCGEGTAKLTADGDGVFTLTLNNATIDKVGTRSTSTIYAPSSISELNLVLQGENTATVPSDGRDSERWGGDGLSAYCNLTIWGPGSLTLTGYGIGSSMSSPVRCHGLYVSKNLSINGGTINAYACAADETNPNDTRIGLRAGIYYQNGGVVTVKGGPYNNLYGLGLQAYDHEAYIRGGKLTAEGGVYTRTEKNEDAIGIPGNNPQLYIKDGATVKVGTGPDDLNDYIGAYKGYHYITVDAGNDLAPYKLTVTGSCKSEYDLGEELDLSGLSATLTMSDGTSKAVSISELIPSGYNKDQKGVQYVTLSYGEGAMAVTADTQIRVVFEGELDHLVDLELSGYSNDTAVMNYDPEKNIIDGEFEFDPDVHEYYVVLYGETYGVSVTYTMLSNTYIYYVNPETNIYSYGAARSESSLGIGTTKSNSTFWLRDSSADEKLSVDGSVRTIKLQAYRYKNDSRVPGDEETLDELTEYTFHIRQAASVGPKFALYDNSESVDKEHTLTRISPSNLGSEQFPKTGNDTLTYMATDDVKENKTVYVMAPYVGYNSGETNNVKLYFKTADGDWVEAKDADGNAVTDPTKTPYKLDLSGYTVNSETGSYEINFKLDYIGDGCGLDREYTLKICMYDFNPVISSQPHFVNEDGETVYSITGIDKTKLKDISLSVEVEDMPEGVPQGEITYQWYGSKYISQTPGDKASGIKTAIKGETSATLTNLDYLMGGSSFLSCDVTRTVDGVSYTTTSTVVLIKVTYPVTYLSPTGFSTEPTVSNLVETCEAGTSPGTYSFQFKSHYINGYPSYDPLYTPEGAEITAFICRKPVDGDESTIEMVEESTIKRSSGISSGGYFYIVDGNYSDLQNAEGEFAEEVTSYTSTVHTGSGSLPASGTAGTYEYFVRLVASKEGYEPAYADSDIIATVTFSAPKALESFEGDGTEKNPLLIRNLEELKTIRDMVNSGTSFSGMHLALDADIELPEDWVPMGSLKEGAVIDGNGKYVNPFSGNFDGQGHTITVAKGGLPLISYARGTTIKNLKIYGEQIEGNGLINDSFIDYGVSGDYNTTGVQMTATLENITLLEGSKTLLSGLADGSGSGINRIIVKNCTVEKNVTIGYDKSKSTIGSFVGWFAGTISDCVSYADVYGISNTGGIAGVKNQSMGDCIIERCAFLGNVNATGNGVGGILGKGYEAESAPNTPTATVRNCYVVGNVTGGNYVGGVFGGEIGVVEAWNDSYVTDNFFYGTVKATSANGIAGGVIGRHGNINERLNIGNNFYLNTGASTGFGKTGTVYEGFNKDEACKAMTAEQFRDGTVLEKLNSSETSYKNWQQGEDGYPVFAKATVITELEVSGDFKNEYYIGDELDLSGLTVKAVYSDGSKEDVALSELTVTGFDTNVRGIQTVTLTFGAVSTTITVTVLQKTVAGEKITVTLSVLGDDVHDVDDENCHTLAEGGLQTWLPMQDYEVELNATVWDVLQTAFKDAGITCDNPSGNYIRAVTYNGVTISENTNGDKCGWMYTLNGKYPLLGISEQYLNDGDKIVFHYTDDYTKERKFGDNSDDEVIETVKELIDAIGTPVTLDSENAILAAREAYDALTDAQKAQVTNYDVLTAAEKALAELQKTDDDEVAASAVEALISAIGTPVTLDSENAIVAARIAYNNLTDLQKELVDNYDELIAAENQLSQLKNLSHNEIYKAAGDYLVKLSKEHTPDVGSVGGEWMVIGLIRSGLDVPSDYFNNVQNYVKQNINENEQLHRSRSTDNSRLILALTALGYDVTDVDGHNLLMGLSDMSYIEKQGINGPIWALIAFDSHNYDIPLNSNAGNQTTREKLIEYILNAQLSDGGWSISNDKYDSDMTAMAIQALAPYYDTNAEAKTAVDKALELLSKVQNADGSFSALQMDGSYIPTAESTAQVIVALTALGINPETDLRFVKNGNSAVDALCSYSVEGGFKHVADGSLNGMATEQGYYALAAYFRLLNGSTSLYDMSDVTIRLGENPNIPDDPNKKPDDENQGDTNKKPDDENQGDTNKKPNDENQEDANKKPDDNNQENMNKKPDNSNQVDTSSKPNGATVVKSPQTGDSSNLVIYLSLMMLSLATLAVTAASKRKKNYE